MCPTQPAKKPKDVLVVDATWENKKKDEGKVAYKKAVRANIRFS